MSESVDSYYSQRRPELLTDFDGVFVVMRDAIASRLKDSEVDQIVGRARSEYESLIPDIPYIGGSENIHEGNLIACVQMLALIRVLEDEGMGEREIGETIYDCFEASFGAMPPSMKEGFTASFFTEEAKEAWRQWGKESESREYPFDWVFELIDGEGQEFDFGLNYTECAVLKFFNEKGAGRYMPYICLGDYAMFKEFGIGLIRTRTLANGASLCDFRFKEGGMTQSGWPPEDLEEFRGPSES
jgi:hypothetical protein